MSLTPQRLKLLAEVEKISRESEFQIAPIAVLIKTFNRSSVTTRMLVFELKKEGLLESPIRGIYRLTPLGKRTLQELRERK